MVTIYNAQRGKEARRQGGRAMKERKFTFIMDVSVVENEEGIVIRQEIKHEGKVIKTIERRISFPTKSIVSIYNDKKFHVRQIKSTELLKLIKENYLPLLDSPDIDDLSKYMLLTYYLLPNQLPLRGRQAIKSLSQALHRKNLREVKNETEEEKATTLSTA